MRLYNLLSQLSGERAVLLSTHIVDDVEQLCRVVAIMQGGKVVARGATAPLVQELAGRIWESPTDASPTSPSMHLRTARTRVGEVYSVLCVYVSGVPVIITNKI